MLTNKFLIIILVPWPFYHKRRIDRDVSSNYTSTNQTQVQTTTKKPTPTLKARTSRRAFTGWSTGRSYSTVELDHLGFPKIPNSPRGTRTPSFPPLRLFTNNTGNTTPGLGQNVSYLHQMLSHLRVQENGTESSTLLSNTTESTESLRLSSIEQVQHTKEVKKIDSDSKRNSHSAMFIHNSVLIAVMASLLLFAVILSAGYWVRRRRRGKLAISPAVDKGRRSAAVVFQAESGRLDI